VVTPTGTGAGTATISAQGITGGATGNATVVVLGHIQTVNTSPGALTLSLTGVGAPQSAPATAQLIDTFGTDVSSQRSVTWKTSDATTVTVNGGGQVLASPATTVISIAVAPGALIGSATVTATSDDGTVGSMTVTVIP